MGSSCAAQARGLANFFGDVVALDGADLDVAPGQVHAIVGHFMLHVPYGDAPNPLRQFDALADLLPLASKG
jgi:hypothetical protein